MFYLHLIHYIGFFGAQTFNSILALLIIKRAGRLFGAYRHAMLVFTLCSMLLSWVEILAQPVLYMKGPMFVVFVDHSSLPMMVRELLPSLHCGTFGFLIAVLAAQFFYRYLALCKTHLLHHFNGSRILLIFLPPLLIYILWFSVVDWGMSATPEKREYLREDLKLLYDADSMTVPFIAPLYWEVTGEKVWRFKDVLSAGICSLIIMLLSTSILFFGLNIYLHMKNSSAHMSQRTLELNRQLFIMLIVQTLIPFITMYIPVGLFIVLPFFNATLGKYVNYPSVSITMYPMIEPLIAMCAISDFRRTIRKLIRKGARVAVMPDNYAMTTNVSESKTIVN